MKFQSSAVVSTSSTTSPVTTPSLVSGASMNLTAEPFVPKSIPIKNKSIRTSTGPPLVRAVSKGFKPRGRCKTEEPILIYMAFNIKHKNARNTNSICMRHTSFTISKCKNQRKNIICSVKVYSTLCTMTHNLRAKKLPQF